MESADSNCVFLLEILAQIKPENLELLFVELSCASSLEQKQSGGETALLSEIQRILLYLLKSRDQQA
jgi:hypothetical protein